MAGRFPMPVPPFPPLAMATSERERLELLTHRLIHKALADYDVHRQGGAKVDARSWKLVRKCEQLAMYKRSEPSALYQPAHARQSATAIRTRAESASIIEGSITQGRPRQKMPLLLQVGAIQGTLDEVMYGTVALDGPAMMLKTACTEDTLLDAETLCQLRGPSPTHPFRFLGVKWVVKGTPHMALAAVVRPRDLVFIEATGILTREGSKEKIGYHLMHSVQVPGYGPLDDKKIVRAQISSCLLYTETPGSVGSVDVFMKARFDPNGSVSEGVATQSAALALMYSAKVSVCAQNKKLLWLLHTSPEFPVQQRPSTAVSMTRQRCCPICAKSFTIFSGTANCELCSTAVCTACSVKKKLAFGKPPSKRVTWRSVAFWDADLGTTSRWDKLELEFVAPKEVEEVDEDEFDEIKVSKDSLVLVDPRDNRSCSYPTPHPAPARRESSQDEIMARILAMRNAAEDAYQTTRRTAQAQFEQRTSAQSPVRFGHDHEAHAVRKGTSKTRRTSMSWLQTHEVTVPYYEVCGGKQVFAIELRERALRQEDITSASSQQFLLEDDSENDSMTGNTSGVRVAALRSYSQFRKLWRDLIRATKTPSTASLARSNSAPSHQDSTPSLAIPRAGSDFSAFHLFLKSYPFPSKLVMKRNTPSVLENRRQGLELFVTTVRGLFDTFPRPFLQGFEERENCHVLALLNAFFGFKEMRQEGSNDTPNDDSDYKLRELDTSPGLAAKLNVNSGDHAAMDRIGAKIRALPRRSDPSPKKLANMQTSGRRSRYYRGVSIRRHTAFLARNPTMSSRSCSAASDAKAPQTLLPGLPKLQLPTSEVTSIQTFLEEFRDHLLLDSRALGSSGTSLKGWNEDRQWELALYVASQIGHVYAVESILYRGTNPNAVMEDGLSSLHAACRGGNRSIVAMLLTYGADTNLIDANGASPLLSAVQLGDLEIVEMLVEFGANVNLCNADSVSAAHVAVACQALPILQLLLEFDAFVNTANSFNGKTPLHLAAQCGSIPMCEQLMQYGGNIHHKTARGLDVVALAKSHASINNSECWDSVSYLESAFHHGFMRLRLKTGDFVYHEDPRLTRELDEFCDVDSMHTPKGPVILLGESGMGKSAFLANWVVRRKKMFQNWQSSYPEFIFSHVVGCSRQSCSVSNLLERILREIKEYFELSKEIPDVEERLSWQFPRFLEAASKKGRVILVVDGLHRLHTNNGESILKWVPLSFPPNVRIIFSGTLNYPTAKVSQVLNANGGLVPRGDERANDEGGLGVEEERRHIVKKFISKRRDNSDQDEGASKTTTGLQLFEIQQNALVGVPMSASPHFLNNFLTALFWAVKEGFNIHAIFESWLGADSVGQLIESVLRSMEIGYKPDQLSTEDAMQFFLEYDGEDNAPTATASVANSASIRKSSSSLARAAAEAAVRETSDSLRVIDFRPRENDTNTGKKGLGQAFSEEEWQALLRALRTLSVLFVQEVVVLPMCKDILRDVIWWRYIGSERAEQQYHQWLIRFFRIHPTTFRRVEELPWHLKRCYQWDALRQVLVNLPMFQLLYTANYKAELFGYWKVLTDGPLLNYGAATSARDPPVYVTPFDIVKEYGKSIDDWYHSARPSTKNFTTIVQLVTRFMHEFCLSYQRPLPHFVHAPFDLKRLYVDGFLFAENLPHVQSLATSASGTSSGTSSKDKETSRNCFFFYQRWVWIQFPWLALGRLTVPQSLGRSGRFDARFWDVKKTVKNASVLMTSASTSLVNQTVDVISPEHLFRKKTAYATVKGVLSSSVRRLPTAALKTSASLPALSEQRVLAPSVSTTTLSRSAPLKSSLNAKEVKLDSIASTDDLTSVATAFGLPAHFQDYPQSEWDLKQSYNHRMVLKLQTLYDTVKTEVVHKHKYLRDVKRKIRETTRRYELTMRECDMAKRAAEEMSSRLAKLEHVMKNIDHQAKTHRKLIRGCEMFPACAPAHFEANKKELRLLQMKLKDLHAEKKVLHVKKSHLQNEELPAVRKVIEKSKLLLSAVVDKLERAREKVAHDQASSDKLYQRRLEMIESVRTANGQGSTSTIEEEARRQARQTFSATTRSLAAKVALQQCESMCEKIQKATGFSKMELILQKFTRREELNASFEEQAKLYEARLKQIKLNQAELEEQLHSLELTQATVSTEDPRLLEQKLRTAEVELARAEYTQTSLLTSSKEVIAGAARIVKLLGITNCSDPYQNAIPAARLWPPPVGYEGENSLTSEFETLEPPAITALLQLCQDRATLMIDAIEGARSDPDINFSLIADAPARSRRRTARGGDEKTATRSSRYRRPQQLSIVAEKSKDKDRSTPPSTPDVGEDEQDPGQDVEVLSREAIKASSKSKLAQRKRGNSNVGAADLEHNIDQMRGEGQRLSGHLKAAFAEIERLKVEYRHAINQLEKFTLTNLSPQSAAQWFEMYLRVVDVGVQIRRGEIRHRTVQRFTYMCMHKTGTKGAVHSGLSIDDGNAIFQLMESRKLVKESLLDDWFMKMDGRTSMFYDRLEVTGEDPHEEMLVLGGPAPILAKVTRTDAAGSAQADDVGIMDIKRQMGFQELSREQQNEDTAALARDAAELARRRRPQKQYGTVGSGIRVPSSARSIYQKKCEENGSKPKAHILAILVVKNGAHLLDLSGIGFHSVNDLQDLVDIFSTPGLPPVKELDLANGFFNATQSAWHRSPPTC
uniref:Uncharacterized protein n=1 Tax=Phytophthora ramorum TaxID=164328 RepID=H3HBI7_PHYRM